MASSSTVQGDEITAKPYLLRPHPSIQPNSAVYYPQDVCHEAGGNLTCLFLRSLSSSGAGGTIYSHSLVGTASLFKHQFILRPPWASMLLSTARVFAKHDSSKWAEQSDVYADVGSPESRVYVCGQIEPIYLSQLDLWGTYTCGCPA